MMNGEEFIHSKLITQSPLKYLRLDRGNYHWGNQIRIFKKHPLGSEILLESTLEHLTISLTREWYTSEIQASMAENKKY